MNIDFDCRMLKFMSPEVLETLHAKNHIVANGDIDVYFNSDPAQRFSLVEETAFPGFRITENNVKIHSKNLDTEGQLSIQYHDDMGKYSISMMYERKSGERVLTPIAQVKGF